MTEDQLSNLSMYIANDNQADASLQDSYVSVLAMHEALRSRFHGHYYVRTEEERDHLFSLGLDKNQVVVHLYFGRYVLLKRVRAGSVFSSLVKGEDYVYSKNEPPLINAQQGEVQTAITTAGYVATDQLRLVSVFNTATVFEHGHYREREDTGNPGTFTWVLQEYDTENEEFVDA